MEYGRYDCQSVPAVRAGAGPDAGIWHGVDAENMTHTGEPQQVSSAQNEPAGQAYPGAAPQGPTSLHEVLPSTQ